MGEGEDPELAELLFDPKGHIVGVGLSFDGRFMSGLSADSSKEFGSGCVPSCATANPSRIRIALRPKAGRR
jgi:hypothetical protein